MGGKSSSSSDSSKKKRDAKQKSKKNRSSSSSSSSSRRKTGKRKRQTDGKRSRTRSGSRKRKRRSVSKRKDRKPQQSASMPMPPLGYASLQQHQQMMMPGLWGNAPPPWAMPPPKDAMVNRQKKEKKDKKEKKEKDKKEKEDKEREEQQKKEAESVYSAQVAALEDKVKDEVASRKEVEERLKASDIDNEKLRAQLAEAQKGQEQQAIRDRTQLKHYIKELNAKNSEIRIFEERIAAHASELKAKDLELRNEAEKNRNAASQISHLTSIREGLLVTVRNLKDRCRQLKVNAKKIETSGTAAPSNPVSVTKASVASVTPEGSNGATQDGARPPCVEKSTKGDLESELSRKVKVAKIRSRPLERRELTDHVFEEPHHREATSGPSALRKRDSEKSGEKRSISFAAEESLSKCFDIASFAAYKKKLWVLKAGSTLECNQCFERAPLSLGNLNLDPSRGQFMQERFLCEKCCGNGASPDGRPVANLLLKDESQCRSEVLNAATEQDASGEVPSDASDAKAQKKLAKVDAPAEPQARVDAPAKTQDSTFVAERSAAAEESK